MNTTKELTLISVDKLVPYQNNARTHSPEQILKLRSSLREFGFVNPVLIDRNFNIIAGHGRVEAAKAEAITNGSTNLCYTAFCRTANIAGIRTGSKRRYGTSKNRNVTKITRRASH